MTYTYVRSEPELWTVGVRLPSGGWEPESDHGSPDEAVARVRYLNGGAPATNDPEEVERGNGTGWCEACDQYVKAEQEIRARALDSAARLLAPLIANSLTEADAVDLWLAAAAKAAQFTTAGVVGDGSEGVNA